MPPTAMSRTIWRGIFRSGSRRWRRAGWCARRSSGAGPSNSSRRCGRCSDNRVGSGSWPRRNAPNAEEDGMQRGMQHWQQGILGLVAGVVLLALLGALPSTLTDRTYQAYSECPSGSGVTCVRVDASPMTVTVQDGTAGTPASAMPSKARYIAVNSSGVLTLIGCNATALINTAVAGTTQLVAAAATQRIYVCAWEVLTSS